MLKDRKGWMAVAVVCSLFTLSLAPDAALAAGKKNKKNKKKLLPGADNNFAWKRIGINEARKTGKPIVLYVYDPKDGKPSTPVKKMQQEVFPNEGVKAAFSDFIMVMQPYTATNWPPHYTWPAKNGVALYIMTSNAIPLMTFTHSNMPKAVKVAGKEEYQLLVAAAATAVKKNPTVVASMEKNPPKEYLSPRELAERHAAKNRKPEEAPEEGTRDAADLLDRQLGGDADSKKDVAEKKRPIIPEDEDE